MPPAKGQTSRLTAIAVAFGGVRGRSLFAWTIFGFPVQEGPYDSSNVPAKISPRCVAINAVNHLKRDHIGLPKLEDHRVNVSMPTPIR